MNGGFVCFGFGIYFVKKASCERWKDQSAVFMKESIFASEKETNLNV